MKTATSRRVYYDFADMLRTNPSGNVPYTPILPLLYGMEASLKLLAEEGMPNVVARHHRCAPAPPTGAPGICGLSGVLQDVRRWRQRQLWLCSTG